MYRELGMSRIPNFDEHMTRLMFEPVFETGEDNPPSSIQISNKKFIEVFPEFKFKSIEEGISHYLDQR